MKLPTKVKVGAWDYTIENWSPKEADAQGHYGETLNTTKTIRIDMGYGAHQGALTLLHEILHVVYCRWRIEKDFNEEQTVDRFTEGLGAVWRDNPQMMTWIHERLAKS